jgi:hypothetical protein
MVSAFYFMCSVLCVLCCFILVCHGAFSVLLYSFSVLLYSSVLLCCSLLFILLCSSSCSVCVFDCIYCTLTLPPGVNPIAVDIYLSIYPSIRLLYVASVQQNTISALKLTQTLINSNTSPCMIRHIRGTPNQTKSNMTHRNAS